MKAEVTLDLCKLTPEMRSQLLTQTRSGGWEVTREVAPKVHPDRKISPHFYRFSVAMSSMDRIRAHRVK
jgi:hypothetical protein